MIQKKQDWKLIELLNWTTSYLKEKAFPNPRITSELLLGHTLRLSRLQLYLNFERKITQEELDRYKSVLKRRLNHEPFQYITGETEFFSLPFRVDPRVLIPRFETELVVEKTIELCQARMKNEQDIYITDIGTGSGNIAISLAHSLPRARITGIDISENILSVAEENARLNSVADRVDFRVRSIFDCGESEFWKLHIVISNPPYVSISDYQKLAPEIRCFEPKEAVTDGDDGYKFFRGICQKAVHWLRKDGFIVFELGLGEGQEVKKIMKQSGFSDIQIFNDYQKIERIIVGFYY